MAEHSFIPSEQKEIYEFPSGSQGLGYDTLLMIGLGVLLLQAGGLYGVEKLWLEAQVQESENQKSNVQSQVRTAYESETVPQDIGTVAELGSLQETKTIDYVTSIENTLLSQVEATSIQYNLKDEEKTISLDLLSPTDSGLFDQEVALNELEFVTEVNFGNISEARGSSATQGYRTTTIDLTIE